MAGIGVLYQFDEKYAPYAGVSITSLIEHNRGSDITIFCAPLHVGQENVEKLECLTKDSGNRIVWLETEKAIAEIKKIKCGSWNGSYATWLKVFVFDQIPVDISRLLYIDSDTLVLGDLSELFLYDMGNKTVAAVMDCLAQHECCRLNVDRYYNAGVMMFNLDRMRANDQIHGLQVHLAENISHYPINDQDLLNDYFRKDICMLPLKYNFQGFLYMYDTVNYKKVYNFEYFYTTDEIERTKKKPTIIHFFRIFGNYPWEKDNIHGCSRIFHEWKKKSPWLDQDDIKCDNGILSFFTFAIEKMLYKILPQQKFLKIYRRIVENP